MAKYIDRIRKERSISARILLDKSSQFIKQQINVTDIEWILAVAELAYDVIKILSYASYFINITYYYYNNITKIRINLCI